MSILLNIADVKQGRKALATDCNSRGVHPTSSSERLPGLPVALNDAPVVSRNACDPARVSLSASDVFLMEVELFL